MDAPRFNSVEEAVEMTKDDYMWAKIIRELDPTLSNDPHKGCSDIMIRTPQSGLQGFYL